MLVDAGRRGSGCCVWWLLWRVARMRVVHRSGPTYQRCRILTPPTCLSHLAWAWKLPAALVAAASVM